jgi:hypothetical protein
VQLFERYADFHRKFIYLTTVKFMFQRTRFAAISAIVVAIMVANTAYARPSGSFRSGFSSGKSNVSRSVGTQRQPGFGSFGKRQAQPPAAARAPQRDSAMSRDLDRKAARDQALRTYDTRRSSGSPGAAGATAAGGAVPPLPPLNPVVPGGQGSTNGGYNGNHRGSGGYAQQGAPAGGVTSAPAPVIVRDSNNGWLWGIGGFMLGHAAGSHAAPPPATAPAQRPRCHKPRPASPATWAAWRTRLALAISPPWERQAASQPALRMPRPAKPAPSPSSPSCC